MKKRIITGLFIGLVLAAAFLLRFVDTFIFDAFLLGIGICSIIEVVKAWKYAHKGSYLGVVIGYLILSYIGLVYAIWHPMTFWGFMFILVYSYGVAYLYAVLFSLLNLKKDKKEMLTLELNKDKTEADISKTDVIKYSLAKANKTAHIMLYPAAFFIIMIALNHFAAYSLTVNEFGNTDFGLMFIVLAFAVTMITDMSAYFVGTLVKGPKLCPKISPKKTISGAIGGILGGTGAALICFAIFNNISAFSYKFGLFNVNIWTFVIYGLIGAIISEIGDLAASVLKRKVGIKDYGTIFPGHGGFMDRVDGLMFTSVYTLIFALVLFM